MSKQETKKSQSKSSLQHLQKIQLNKNISTILQTKQKYFFQQIEKGKISVSEKSSHSPPSSKTLIITENRFSNCHDQRIQSDFERLNIHASNLCPQSSEIQNSRFRNRDSKLYKKNETAIKQMQNKLKSWMSRQQHSEQLREKFIFQRDQSEQKTILQQKQKKHRLEQERKAQHHQQVMSRYDQMLQDRQKRSRSMRCDNFKLTTPLFIQIQNKFQQKQKIQEQQRQKQLKKRRELLYGSEGIKQHEIKYLQKLKAEGRDNITPLSHKKEEEHGKFVLLFNRIFFQDRLKQQSKRQRIREYIANLKQKNPVNSERVKRSRTQAHQSRTKQHPTQKQLGDQYLRLARNQKKSGKVKSSLTKVQSLPNLPRYPNYLGQIRQVPSQTVFKPKDPVSALISLKLKSLKIEGQLMKKVKGAKMGQKPEKYESTIRKEMEIDEIHHRLLHTRMACLQMY